MTDWLSVKNESVCVRGGGCNSKEDGDRWVASTGYWTLLYVVLEPLVFT